MLLNLLIAMLTSTYDDNKKDAQQGWKLHRASVLVRIDGSMTEQQRRAPDKVFWQTSPEDTSRRCDPSPEDANRARQTAPTAPPHRALGPPPSPGRPRGGRERVRRLHSEEQNAIALLCGAHVETTLHVERGRLFST